jgi:hypothetical protein
MVVLISAPSYEETGRIPFNIWTRIPSNSKEELAPAVDLFANGKEISVPSDFFTGGML